MIYFDASALVPIAVEQADSRAVQSYMDHLQVQPSISDFAIGEVASALSRLVRMNLLASETADALWAGFQLWVEPLSRSDCQPIDIARATALTRRYDLKLRLPDAIHLAICLRADATLVTLDLRLATAARIEGAKTVIPA